MSHVSRSRSASWFAAVAALGLAVTVPGVAHAAVTQIVNYNFPASWPGTGTVVTDLSPAGNNGIVSTTLTKQPSLSTAQLPPGAAAGTASLVTNLGGSQTTAKQLLSNANLATAGGFTYSVEFRWDGTDNTSHIGKIIDYAGTESLQVDTVNTTAGTANLSFLFTTQGTPDTTLGPTIPIVANTWYQATAVFDTLGNAVAGDGSLAGLASLSVGPVGGTPVSVSLPVTKTTYGDGLNRPIGFGELGFPSTTSALVLFQGDIYNPSVSLGAVPEPASLSLLGLGATALLARRRRA